jgi:VIT1/CCC1 family predicted Fe2+/Mn2+ transporter
MSGTFRAAVFGANDGLVSNLALILGIVASGAGSSTVLLTGFAGLLAGAMSMAAGEYVSVRSQRELLEASASNLYAQGAVPHLDVNANELALVYRARGMSEDDAAAYARGVLAGSVVTSADGEQDVEAYGVDLVDEHETIGTGAGAAASSFCFFATGALIPVLPYLFGLEGLPAVLVSSGLVGLALLATGATVGILSGGPPVRRALRQLAIGFGAAAVTYGLGLLFGAVNG